MSVRNCFQSLLKLTTSAESCLWVQEILVRTLSSFSPDPFGHLNLLNFPKRHHRSALKTKIYSQFFLLLPMSAKLFIEDGSTDLDVKDLDGACRSSFLFQVFLLECSWFISWLTAASDSEAMEPIPLSPTNLPLYDAELEMCCLVEIWEYGLPWILENKKV